MTTTTKRKRAKISTALPNYSTGSIVKKMRGPTVMQKRVLNYIKGRMKSKDVQPVHREMAAHFGISYGSIQGHLLALQKKGCLTWIPGKARTFRILKA